MLCKTPQELLDRVRAEAGRSDDVLCSDNPGAALIGFRLQYDGRTVQHSVRLKDVKEWEPPCRTLMEMFLSTDGRRNLALAMKKGRPFHESCGVCLAAHIMEG